MKAYHNNPKLKEEVLAELQLHKEADAFIRGTYWDEDKQKGCAVGCLTQNPNGGGHAELVERFGVPLELWHLDDRIFELLSLEDSKSWPLDFMAAINVGADLSLVASRLMHWLMTDEDGPRQYVEDKATFETVAELYARRFAGDEPSLEEWMAAARAAEEAARAAAWAARAAWAAWAAAWAAWAATRAAWAAWADGEAAWAAGEAAYNAARATWADEEKEAKRIGDKLLELLRDKN